MADYGAGSNTGTVTQYLAVDSNGNIIEEPVTSANGDFWTLLENEGTNPATAFTATRVRGIFQTDSNGEEN